MGTKELKVGGPIQTQKNHRSYYFFKDLVDTNIYNPADPLHLHAARYCLGPIFQKDLDSVAECWNSHRIRPSATDTILGIPDELYSFPEIIGAKNMLLPIHREDIKEMDRFLMII